VRRPARRDQQRLELGRQPPSGGERLAQPYGHVDKYPRLREEAAALKAELALIPTA
jgi:hypothetical protein